MSTRNSSFFNFIQETYSKETAELMKSYSKLGYKKTNTKNRQIFLLKCREYGVIPNFLNFKQNHIEFECKYLTDQFQKNTLTYKRKLLNLLITQTHKNLDVLNSSMNELSNNIKSNIPQEQYTPFFSFELQKQENNFNKIKQKNIKKLEKLTQKSAHKNANVCPNWLENMTDIEIPNDVADILSLGPKFSMPLEKITEKHIDDIIASVESGIKHLTNDKADSIRHKITHAILRQKNHNNSNNRSLEAKILKQKINKTKTFIKNNPNIYIITPDKSNKTIIIDKKIYEEKMKAHLSDTTTYKKIKNDPTNITQNKNNDIIKRWHKLKYITEQEKRHLTIHNAQPPKMYGLLKIHKEGMPIRPVIAHTQAPLYNLSKFLSNTLKNIAFKNQFYIQNSFTFKKTIDSIHINNDEVMISLDVKSLYTNIPVKLAEKIITKKWDDIKNHTKIPKSEFLIALRLILNSNFFQYNEDFYTQLEGAAMGSPISSVIAQIVMEDLEENVINNLTFDLPFYQRYVDDSFAIIHKDHYPELLERFNNYHPKLQFTIELEKNNRLNFLDMTLIKNEKNNKIETMWYTKETASGRYLNFNSTHPLNHKKNVITAVIDRAIKLTSPKHRQQTIEKGKHLLLQNNHPLELINKIIKKRIHSIYNTQSTQDNTNNPEEKYIAIPYIPNLSENISRTLKKENITVAHKSLNHIKKYFTPLKNKISTQKTTHTVYEIPCNNCQNIYIGQSQQYLKKRIDSHKYTKNASTALSKHSQKTGHKFNFQNTKILTIEPNYNKRIIKEMIMIQKKGNTVNDRSEIEGLSRIYRPLIEKNRTSNNPP